MIASRLNVPVVPVRVEGLDRVLHHTWRMAMPGRVRVAFGAPLHLDGDDYEALAKTGRGCGQGPLNLVIWSSGHLVIWTRQFTRNQ